MDIQVIDKMADELDQEIISLKEKIDIYSYTKYFLNLSMTLSMFGLFFVSGIGGTICLGISLLCAIALFFMDCAIHSFNNRRDNKIIDRENLHFRLIEQNQ